jgi:ribosome-binding protein aMBF1 (putative translation factor)
LVGGCWLWLGNKHKQGYGKISVNGRAVMAHRVSYEMNCSEIPLGMMVCHKCDNPKCVNPDHLFLGSAQDNMTDKIMKGRHRGARRGESHHLAKLNKDQVMAIRDKYRDGNIFQRELASQYGVSQALINRIINNSVWSYV